MLELLTIAALSLPWCDPVEDYWDRVYECVEVSGQSATAGGLTADLPVVYIPKPNDAENVAGAISLRIGPEPSEGHYRVGVVPVCIKETGSGQTVTRAGGGGLGEMFPPDHYWSADSLPLSHPDFEDDGFLLAFDVDPCLLPEVRAGVVYVGYSELPLAVAEGDGFSNGSNCVEVALGEFCLSFEWTGTTWDIEYEAVGATWAGNNNAVALTNSLNAFFGANASITRYCYDGETLLNQSTRNLLNYNSGWGGLPGKVTSDFSCVTGNRFVIELSGAAFPALPSGPWFDTDDRSQESDGYVGEAFLVHSDVFNDFLYIQPVRPWNRADGVCEDQECLDTYCDEYGFAEIIQYTWCLIRWDVSWAYWFGHTAGQLSASPMVKSLQYTWEVALAYPQALVYKDGQCGVLGGSLADTPLNGFTIDTCALPYQYEFRTIAGAFFLLGWLFFVWRTVQNYLTHGHPSAPKAVSGKEGDD